MTRFPEIMSSLRSRVTTLVCAQDPSTNQEDRTHWLGSSAMLVLGPVRTLKVFDTRFRGGWPASCPTRGYGARIRVDDAEDAAEGELTLEEGELTYDWKREYGTRLCDESRGWPIFHKVKQKRPITVLPHTKKMCICMYAYDTHATVRYGIGVRDESR